MEPLAGRSRRGRLERLRGRLEAAGAVVGPADAPGRALDVAAVRVLGGEPAPPGQRRRRRARPSGSGWRARAGPPRPTACRGSGRPPPRTPPACARASPSRARGGTRPAAACGESAGDLVEQRQRVARARLREQHAREAHAREVGVGRPQRGERHRAQRLDRLARAARGERAPCRARARAWRAPPAVRAGSWSATAASRARAASATGEPGVLAVEPVEGGGRRGAIAARELRVAQSEQGLRQLARAGRDHLLERARRPRPGGRRPRAARAARGQRAADDAAAGLGRRREVRARRGVGLAERLLRLAAGRESVVAQRRARDVRVRELGDRLGVPSQVEQAQARREVGEPGGGAVGVLARRGAQGVEAGGAVARGGVAQRGLGGVGRVAGEAPGRARRRGHRERRAKG